MDLNSKSGLHLYTEAQEALKVPFNGKAANVQPFLNSLAVDVKKFCLDTAVTVTNAAGPVNLLTHHGSFSETDTDAFFNTARTEQITGNAAAGGAAVLAGTGDAAQLAQAKMIQCSKILFHKLSKSLTVTFEKQIIPEMNKMDEDGTRLLYHILKVTMSTTATASTLVDLGWLVSVASQRTTSKKLVCRFSLEWCVDLASVRPPFQVHGLIEKVSTAHKKQIVLKKLASTN